MNKNAIFFILLVSSSAFGGENFYPKFKGTTILGSCADYGMRSDTPDRSYQGICKGYILGVIESNPTICVPKETSILTIVKTVRSYLKRPNLDLSLPATKLVTEAALESWPCTSS